MDRQRGLNRWHGRDIAGLGAKAGFANHGKFIGNDVAGGGAIEIGKGRGFDLCLQAAAERGGFAGRGREVDPAALHPEVEPLGPKDGQKLT